MWRGPVTGPSTVSVCRYASARKIGYLSDAACTSSWNRTWRRRFSNPLSSIKINQKACTPTPPSSLCSLEACWWGGVVRDRSVKLSHTAQLVFSCWLTANICSHRNVVVFCSVAWSQSGCSPVNYEEICRSLMKMAEICLLQRVHLDIQVGEHANNYAEIAAKDKLTELQLRVRQLAEQVDQIQKEQDYQRVSQELWRCCCQTPYTPHSPSFPLYCDQ